MAAAHRVDLNLIVDHGWPAFLQNAPTFVEEVDDDQDICDILAALKPQNITAEGGMYAGLPPIDIPETDRDLENQTTPAKEVGPYVSLYIFICCLY